MAAERTSQKRGTNSSSSRRKPKDDRTVSPADIAKNTASQLASVTGRVVESATGLERTDDGWKVWVEVVEARRIPDSADILALYEVRVDNNTDLLEYRRIRRYGRGHGGDG